jgi:transposase
MEVMVEKCCGLDVHKKVIVACVLCGSFDTTRPKKETKSFKSTTKALEELAQWLLTFGVTEIAMESTSQYWCPVWNVLEKYDFKLLLVNPQRIKALPGKKTDQKDSERIAELCRVGLLPNSYMPEKEFQELRRLTRTRSQLLHERTQHRNRIQNIFECANIKIGDYLSSVFGKTGTALIKLLMDGVVITQELVAKNMFGRLTHTSEELFEAMNGTFSKNHLIELSVNYTLMEALDKQIKVVENAIDEIIERHSEVYDELLSIPGVAKNNAAVILAEIGDNVKAFNSAKQLASWAGICPGCYESAGVRKSTHIGHGNKYLKTALYQSALTAAHSGNLTFATYYSRIAARGSKQKAVIATAHKILRIVFKILESHTSYQDQF